MTTLARSTTFFGALLIYGLVFTPTVSAESKKGSHGEAAAKPAHGAGEPKKEAKKKPKEEPVVGKPKFSHQTFENVKPKDGPLQIVLLLDSSRSMQRNDPENLRNQAAKLLLRFLSEEDSVAILRFDRDVAPISEFQSISVENLSALDNAIDTIPLEGNFTNLEQPVKAAYDLLSEQSQKGRRPVVILLSDGKMDPAPVHGSPVELTHKVVNVELPEYRRKKIPLYTLALGEEADAKLLEKFANAGRGTSWAATDVSTIHERFTELFLELKQPVITPLTEDGFLIDSSVNEATFYVSHEAKNAEITLIKPSEETLSASDSGGEVRWFHGASFEIVTVSKPEPGNWKIHGIEKAKGFATLLSDLNLQVQWPNEKLRMGDNVAAFARLIDKGKPVSVTGIHEHLAITFAVEDSTTHETLSEGELVDTGEEGDQKKQDNLFSKTIRLNSAGDFTIRFFASTPTFRREQYRHFQATAGSVTLQAEEREEHSDDGTSRVKRYFRAILAEEAEHLKSPALELVLKRPNGKEKIYSFQHDEHDTKLLLAEVPEGLDPGHYTVRARLTGSTNSKKSCTSIEQ